MYRVLPTAVYLSLYLSLLQVLVLFVATVIIVGNLLQHVRVLCGLPTDTVASVVVLRCTLYSSSSRSMSTSSREPWIRHFPPRLNSTHTDACMSPPYYWARAAITKLELQPCCSNLTHRVDQVVPGLHVSFALITYEIRTPYLIMHVFKIRMTCRYIMFLHY